MLTQIKSILIRCFVLSIVFLLVAYDVYTLFYDTVLSLIHQFFGVSVAEAKSVIFNFYCGIKVVAVWLFLVPALSIAWFQYDANKQQKVPAKKKK